MDTETRVSKEKELAVAYLKQHLLEEIIQDAIDMYY